MSQALLTTLLHLALATLTMAAPTMTIAKENAWQYGAGGGVVGFIVFILDVIVIGKFCCFSLPPYFMRGMNDERMGTRKANRVFLL